MHYPHQPCQLSTRRPVPSCSASSTLQYRQCRPLHLRQACVVFHEEVEPLPGDINIQVGACRQAKAADLTGPGWIQHGVTARLHRGAGMRARRQAGQAGQDRRVMQLRHAGGGQGAAGASAGCSSGHQRRLQQRPAAKIAAAGASAGCSSGQQRRGCSSGQQRRLQQQPAAQGLQQRPAVLTLLPVLLHRGAAAAECILVHLALDLLGGVAAGRGVQVGAREGGREEGQGRDGGRAQGAGWGMWSTGWQQMRGLGRRLAAPG